MSSEELQALFANLRPRSFQDRTSSSPAPAQPSHNSASSPIVTKDHEATSSRQPPNTNAQNLLNLLNYKSPISTSDVPIDATKQSKIGVLTSSATTPRPISTEPSKDELQHQNEYDPGEAAKDVITSPNGSKGPDTNVQFVGSTPVTPLPQSTQNMISTDAKPLFTYRNPFEALKASRTQTPRDEAGEKQVPASPVDTATAADLAVRRKLAPNAPSFKNDITSHASETRHSASQSAVAIGDRPEDVKIAKQSVPLATIVSTSKTVQSSEKPTASAAAQNTQQTFQADDSSGEWEDSQEITAPRTIPVYNFPIKAFVSITLQLSDKSSNKIRDGSVMEISRLKKGFDQLDRTLAAATSKYIGYAFAKHGGLRIIRQEDGSDRQIFRESQDRIFNVAFCTTSVLGPSSETQAIIGTGISGAVYYAVVEKKDQDFFEANELEKASLIFPPFSDADENAAGGMLKTRVKRSSRHPDFFAIGRGKYIHIHWPRIDGDKKYLTHPSNGVVDVERLHEKRPVYIKTGKAGKDFAFSEDDTCIVSLDKTGRLRFWDIRLLTQDEGAAASESNPLVVDKPILSLSTISSTEKSRPTSVLFVDKARPYAKGTVLRYVLVGLHQNHTLQLWDIALNKAVQELNFPHGNDTDAICSVCYHPPSGIIVVGHPTRNSLFFVHLSAPKYTLSSQTDQAAYFTFIADKDSSISIPDSTACFSGVREISFADRGDLRSVELLPIQKVHESAKSTEAANSSSEPATLFELYVAHSRGVTCLAINRTDLGWNTDNKVVKAVDAKKAGMVKVEELSLGSLIEEPARSKTPPKETQQPPKTSKKKAKKAAQAIDEALLIADVQQTEKVLRHDPVTVSTTESVVQDISRDSKKSKKKMSPPRDQLFPGSEIRSVSPAKQDSAPASSSNETVRDGPKPEPTAVPFSIEPLKIEIQNIEKAIAAGFRKELAILQDNISADRTTLDQSSLTRQEAIIRLVSSSLSTNVEKSLSRIVMQKIESDVLPALLQSTSTHMTDILGQQLQQIVSREVNTGLSTSVAQSLEKASTTSIPDAISRNLLSQIDKQLSDVISRSLTPLCESIAKASAAQTASNIQNQLNAEIQKLQASHAADRLKFEKLSQALQGMADTLQAISESQIAFQEQILRDRQQYAIPQQLPTEKVSPPATMLVQPSPIKPKTSDEIEIDDISAMMEQGRYEEGTIKWLQSSQPVQLFDQVFVRFTTDYLASEVSPLVAFSVAVTVANALDNHVERRIEWIAAALDAVDASDPEMSDLSQHAPALISAIVQKLESLYMNLAERQHDDPILRPISVLVKKARGIGSLFLSRGQGTP